jgi:hypothetical protein
MPFDNPLFKGCANGYFKTVRLLLKTHVRVNNEGLVDATGKGGHQKPLQLLKEAGAEISIEELKKCN